MVKNKKIFPKLKKKLKWFLTDESGKISKKDALWLAVGAVLLSGVDTVAAHTNWPAWHYNQWAIGCYSNWWHSSAIKTWHSSAIVNWHSSAVPNWWHSSTGIRWWYLYQGHMNWVKHGSHGSHWSHWSHWSHAAWGWC